MQCPLDVVTKVSLSLPKNFMEALKLCVLSFLRHPISSGFWGLFFRGTFYTHWKCWISRILTWFPYDFIHVRIGGILVIQLDRLNIVSTRIFPTEVKRALILILKLLLMILK